jgi:serine phosphatase RsbU (regulator of sigma subunit)
MTTLVAFPTEGARLDDTLPGDDWAKATTVMHRAPGIAASAAPERTCFLVVIEGAEPGRRIRLGPDPLIIGRAAPADIQLDDQEISRRHCRVHVDPAAGIFVADLGSTNGTFMNGKPIGGAELFAEGSFLQIGGHVLRCERLTAKEAERIEELTEDLRKARDYVLALLPRPLAEGPIRAHWIFVPSTQLGGDALGYQWLDERHFAVYVVDVSGHGAQAALHCASIMNTLRHRSLPHTDFTSPAATMQGLNAAFLMDEHAGMVFTAWYGVFDSEARTLAYCSAGHHPAQLKAPGRGVLEPLATRNLVAGASPDYVYKEATAPVPPGSTLYVFSDGVFEFQTREGRQAGLTDLLPLLDGRTIPGLTEPQRVNRAIREVARPGPLDDDFSLLAVTFL